MTRSVTDLSHSLCYREKYFSSFSLLQTFNFFFSMFFWGFVFVMTLSLIFTCIPLVNLSNRKFDSDFRPFPSFLMTAVFRVDLDSETLYSSYTIQVFCFPLRCNKGTQVEPA